MDENNNSWDVDVYTKADALKLSRTMINCQNCQNCRDCRYCQNCLDCQASRYCQACRNCQNCQASRHCRDCRNMVNCQACRQSRQLRNCHNCQACLNCQNCQGCRHCRNCRNCLERYKYTEQPNIYSTKEIGSRNSITYFYLYNGGIDVLCDCFSDSLENFEKKIKKTYPEEHEYRISYMQEINIVKRLWRKEYKQ